MNMLLSKVQTPKLVAQTGQWYVVFAIALVWLYFLYQLEQMPDIAADKVQKKSPPIEVALSEPAPVPPPKIEKPVVENLPAKPSGSAIGKDGKAVKIQAIYENHAQVFGWLLNNGGRILMRNEEGYGLAEINAQGEMQTAQGKLSELSNGELRQATADVVAFIKSPLPDGISDAVVWWPNHLWHQILSVLISYQAQSAKIAYRVVNGALVVTIRKVVTAQGIINLNKMVIIK